MKNNFIGRLVNRYNSWFTSISEWFDSTISYHFMHIEERDVCGMTFMVPNPRQFCPVCGEEMSYIPMYGEVCFTEKCDNNDYECKN